MRIIKYTDEFEEKWDVFVLNSAINGNWLQSRRFLNYHPPGRFKDASFMIIGDKEEIIAVCPACEYYEDGRKIICSHRGSTYGGIIIEKKYYAAIKLIEILKMIKDYARNEGFTEIKIKMPVEVQAGNGQYTDDLFQYAFQYSRFSEYKELNLLIDRRIYDEDILSNISNGKRGHIRNCIKNGLRAEIINDDVEIEKFYDILTENLSKYNAKPVHTLEELIEFKNKRLKKECMFIGVYENEEMIAGGMLFLFEKAKCIHTQYLSAKQSLNKLSPASFLYYSVIEQFIKMKYDYLTWGICTEDMGRYLNEGLVQNKEAYGSSYCVNRTYIIEI